MGKDVSLPESHKGVLLLSSIGLDSSFENTAAALRTRDATDLTFEFGSQTLMDEEKSRTTSGKSNTPSSSHSGRNSTVAELVAQKKICSFCKQKGHVNNDFT